MTQNALIEEGKQMTLAGKLFVASFSVFIALTATCASELRSDVDLLNIEAQTEAAKRDQEALALQRRDRLVDGYVTSQNALETSVTELTTHYGHIKEDVDEIKATNEKILDILRSSSPGRPE